MFHPSIFHPSIFQKPAFDVALDKDRALVDEVDPATMWGSEQSPTGDSKPFTRREKQQLLSGISLCMNLNINKDLLPLLLPMFMSKRNLENLQDALIAAVQRYSGHIIGRQSDMELARAMLAIYESQARNVNETLLPKAQVVKHIRDEICRLNGLVLADIVPGVVNAVEQHLSFITAQENPRPAESLSRPINTNTKGLAQYRSPSEINNVYG